MKYVFVILTLILSSCSFSSKEKEKSEPILVAAKISKKPVYFAKDVAGNSVDEVCLNGVVYYVGWSGGNNGGGLLAPKYTMDKDNNPKLIPCSLPNPLPEI